MKGRSFKRYAFTFGAGNFTMLGANENRVALLLSAPDQFTYGIAFGEPCPVSGGIQIFTAADNLILTRELLGDGICQTVQLWCPAAVNFGVLEIVDPCCRRTDDGSGRSAANRTGND
jgi:hypothetical protein